MTNHDLSQAATRKTFEAEGFGPWTVVYDEVNAEGLSGGSYSALANPDARSNALDRDGWLVTKTDGRPGFMQSYAGGQTVSTYLSDGGLDDGVELLVRVREFYGAAEDTLELEQEFRLFHNLLFDRSSNTYIKMNEDGSRTPAVRTVGRRMEIRTPLLKQYIAAKQMDLLLFTDVNVYSDSAPDNPNTERYRTATYSGRLDHFRSQFSKSGSFGSRYCATKVIPAGPVDSCGIWPFDEDDDHFPDFIIGEDEYGKPIKFTCNPDALANYFGANPGAPHYLTSVHFRREVLARYYAEPETYSVEDGYVRCVSLWGLEIDNDHEDRVTAFLGDLGSRLPAGERDHWRAHMIPPDAPISETNFRRSFLAQPTDPNAIDLVFRRTYDDAIRVWEAHFGWPLFREPKESDVYLLQQVRVPLKDTHNEFEDSIKVLGKLMSDALNERSIGAQLPEKIENEKGISKFERLLRQDEYPHVERDIAYLRRVQDLRSKVSAHLKGSDYQKALSKNLGEARGAEAIRGLLNEGIAFLGDLMAWVGTLSNPHVTTSPTYPAAKSDETAEYVRLVQELGYTSDDAPVDAEGDH